MDETDSIPIQDLSRGWIASSPEAVEVAARVLKSGWYTHGLEHDAFETELAQYVGSQFAIGVASGTDAIRLALQAVACGNGSTVAVAPNAGAYAAVAAASLGASCICLDVDPRTLLVTADTIRRALHTGVDAIVVTHLFGNLADMPKIVELCQPAGIPVIEDCAQALGGVISGRSAGTWGTAGAFSFYPTKNLGGAGDGGAVVTSDPRVAADIRRLRQYGWDTKYTIGRAGGLNSRLDDIQAALLRAGLPRLTVANERRNEILDSYRTATDEAHIRLVTGDGCDTTGHLAVLEVLIPGQRDKVRDLFDLHSIQTDLHYPMLDLDQPGLTTVIRASEVPAARNAVNNILTIPCFPELTDFEVARVTKALKAACMMLANRPSASRIPLTEFDEFCEGVDED